MMFSIIEKLAFCATMLVIILLYISSNFNLLVLSAISLLMMLKIRRAGENAKERKKNWISVLCCLYCIRNKLLFRIQVKYQIINHNINPNK